MNYRRKRREMSRNLICAGVSQTVAMQVTGHLTPSIFRRYDITTDDDVRQGLGKLADLAGEERGKIRQSWRVVKFDESS